MKFQVKGSATQSQNLEYMLYKRCSWVAETAELEIVDYTTFNQECNIEPVGLDLFDVRYYKQLLNTEAEYVGNQFTD